MKLVRGAVDLFHVTAPNRQSILVCDDDAPIRAVVRLRLEMVGYSVREARTGAEGLAMAKAEPPTLILTDHQMPEMNGLEMARELAQLETTCEVPLLLITARGYVLNPKDLEGTNIRAVIAKPFGVRLLLDRIATIVGTQLRDEAAAA